MAIERIRISSNEIEMIEEVDAIKTIMLERAGDRFTLSMEVVPGVQIATILKYLATLSMPYHTTIRKSRTERQFTVEY